MKTTINLILLLILPFVGNAQTLYDILRQNDELREFRWLVSKADLYDVFSDPDADLTVFALSNNLVDSLDRYHHGYLDKCIDTDKRKADIVNNHMVEGPISSGSLENGLVLSTVFGDSLFVTKEGDRIFINEAEVIMRDITASNGVFHVIDEVILPEYEINSVADIFSSRCDLSLWEDYLKRSGYYTALQGEGPFTIFATTNNAVDNWFTWASSTSEDTLRRTMARNIATDSLRLDSLFNGRRVPVLDGSRLWVGNDGTETFINGTQIVVGDIEAPNGFVHLVQWVILPIGISSIAEVDPSAVTISPNPVQSEFTLKMEASLFDQPNYQLIDATGQIIKDFKGFNTSNTFDISEVPSGIYFFLVYDDKRRSVERLVKL